MEIIISLTKKGLIVLFIPMFFASIMLLTQSSNVYKVLKYKSGLKMGRFIVKNITDDATGGTASEGGTT